MKSEAQLLREIAEAPNQAAQFVLVGELDSLRAANAARIQDERDLDWANTVVGQTLAPALAHAHHTAATDWLDEAAAPPADEVAHQAVLAEAALWFNRREAAVKADPEEFAEQARGYARRVASQYGEEAPVMARAFLDYVAFLMRREGASGLDQIQQTIDPNNNPKPTQMPTDTFDTFQDPIAPENQGVEEQQSSYNAPLLNEILQEGGGQGQPEVAGGHSTGDTFAGPPNPNAANMGRGASLDEPWDGRSVANNYLMNMDDFRAQEAQRTASVSRETLDPTVAGQQPGVKYDENGQSERDRDVDEAIRTGQPVRRAETTDEYNKRVDQGIATGQPVKRRYAERRVVGEVTRQGASGLPQIDQVIDPNNNYAPTPYPTEVAFPLEGEFAEQHSTAEVPGYPQGGPRANPARQSSLQTQADMFGNSDTMPNSEIGSYPPYNTPSTVPQRGTGFEQGRQQGAADAASGARPTYADAGAKAEPFQQGYAQGFSETKRGGGHPDVPFSMDRNVTSNDSGSLDQSQQPATASRRTARRIVSAKTAAHPEYQRGFQFAASYRGGDVPSPGSPEFESGLYAGIRSNAAAQQAWVDTHKNAGPAYQRRIAIHQAYTEHLRREADITESEPPVQFGTGVPVGESYEPAGPGFYPSWQKGDNNSERDGTLNAEEPNRQTARRRQAATSVDLDTMNPAGNPDPGGQTPLNGPGTPPPGSLDGQPPAAPGGPSPYNGAPPYGKPVAPDPGLNPQTQAFRRSVQAGLLRATRQSN